MKRIYWLMMLMITSVAMVAQTVTQQGVVKTRGRMVNGKHVPGQGLSGAAVQVQGRSAVVSRQNGNFSFPVPSQSFLVQSVTKQGYQLVDEDVTRKPYHHSANPIYLVMETPEQQMQDKLDAERKLRRTLQRQLQQREDEIEAMSVSLQEKQRMLQQLYQDQQNNEKLIADMAKEYAAMDYDQMDALNQRISDAILDGRLTEADSLLRSKGDIRDRIASILREQSAETKEESELAKRQENLQASKAGTRKKLEDVASDCYTFFNRFKMDNQHDSAAYYIALRAEIDTTNVFWQKDAAYYLYNYTNRNMIVLPDWRVESEKNAHKFEKSNNLADKLDSIWRARSAEPPKKENDPALIYAQRALRLAEQQGLGNELLAAELHMLLGDIYESFSGSSYSNNSNRHYSQGATIVFHKYGENHPYVADYYYHSLAKSAPYRVGFLMTAFNYQENKRISEELQIDGNPVNPFRCIDIWKNALINPVEGIDSVYILSRLGDASFFLLKDIGQAEVYYQRGLAAYIKNSGERSLETGRMYYKLSDIFYSYMRMWKLEKGDITQEMVKLNASQTFSYLANSLCALSASVNSQHRETRDALHRLISVRRDLNRLTFDADSLLNRAHPVLAVYQTKMKRSGLWDSITSDTASVNIVVWNQGKIRDVRENVWKMYSLQELLVNNFTGNMNVTSGINLRLLELTKALYEQSPTVWFDDYAESLGNQSYFTIFMKQYAEAEHLALEGIAIDSTKHWIASNLAAALLFQGRYAESEKIYRQYKLEMKDGFLEDFRQFAEAGVIPKEREADVERIKKILNE